MYDLRFSCYNEKKERDTMPALQNEMYTIEDIYALPDGKRAELIDGVIYDMAPPSFQHQKILNHLSTEINIYIRSKKGTCEVVPAPFAVFLNANDKIYVEPDISVICDKTKIEEKGCFGAPDFIIEIVSPSSKRMDYHIKLFKYHTAGVREYWIVDPMKKLITTYNFDNETTEIYTFAETVKAGIYEELEIDFSEVLSSETE